jgi:cytochrome P450
MSGTSEVAIGIEDLDPPALAGHADPYPVLNRLRESCPLGHSDTHGGFWNLFRFADVAEVAADAQRFSSRDNTIPSEKLPMPAPPIQTDPPQHMQFRQPFLKRYSPQAIGHLTPAIQAKVNELIDGFIERGTADLTQELFIPYPAYAALKLMDLPEDDFPTFFRWARQIFSVEHSDEAGAGMFAYFTPLFDQLTGSLEDTIPAIGRNLRIDGREIQPLEFAMLLMTLLLAGLDTTANASSQIALLLDDQPDVRRRLVEAPELIPSAVEELLRHTTPLPTIARTATEDVTIGSTTICAGEKVALHYMAANHDPAEFPDPGQVVLGRTPNRHLAFGRGPHRCLGMHVARLELQVMLTELLRRIPDFVVERDRVVRSGGVTRGVESLPVRFTPGPREGGSSC